MQLPEAANGSDGGAVRFSASSGTIRSYEKICKITLGFLTMYSYRRAASKINTRLFSIIACSGLASTALAASAPVSPWTTYQGNVLHTGYVPITLNPSKFTPLWNVTIGSSGAALHQVTEADGLVFLTQNGYFSDQGLYVLAAKNGARIWSLAFPGIFSVNPPAYDDGNVYIQTVDNSGDTWVRGYVAASGTPIFQSAADAQWENYLAPTIVDHTLYMDGGTYGGMYSFNGATGAQNWFAPLAQFDEWTPAVDAKYAYSYLGGDYSGEPALLTAVSRSTDRR
jgi:outer membrane protein assembly factor BamB